MALLSNILGLDIGSHSLKAVELRQTMRGVEILALHTLPRDSAETPLSECVRHFLRMHRLSTDHVVCALPGDQLSTRRMSFPFRDRKKLAQAIPFEIEANTLFELDDVLVDWEIVGGDRNRGEVVTTIAPRKAVSETLTALAEAGCEPRTLEAEGLVLSHVSSLLDLPDCQLLVDLGHRKTTCCLIAEGRPVAARTFPVAGAALTEALARDRALPIEQAEASKCESGVFGAAITDAPPQTAAALDRIARELVRTIGSFEAEIAALGTGGISQIALFGGSAKLDRIDEYLTARTDIPTRRLAPPPDERGGSLLADADLSLFAPALSLALRGTAQPKTRSDFRQDEFAVRLDLGRYRKELTWPATLAAIALFLGFVSIATATVLEGMRAGQVETRIERLYTQVLPGDSLPPDALATMRKDVQSASERADFLGVYRGNLSALDLLTKISQLVPEDLEVVFEELSIDRQVIRIRVYGEDFQSADRLVTSLAKFEPFARAHIGAIETDPKRGGKRFNVTISLAHSEDGE
jgi:general secretion pathway protein L